MKALKRGDRIPQQCVVVLNDRLYRLTRGGGPAAEDGRYAIAIDQLFGLGSKGGRLGCAVLLDVRNLAAVDAAGLVDLVDGKHLRVTHGHFGNRH